MPAKYKPDTRGRTLCLIHCLLQSYLAQGRATSTNVRCAPAPSTLCIPAGFLASEALSARLGAAPPPPAWSARPARPVRAAEVEATKTLNTSLRAAPFSTIMECAPCARRSASSRVRCSCNPNLLASGPRHLHQHEVRAPRARQEQQRQLGVARRN